jgi:hypothetical protein
VGLSDEGFRFQSSGHRLRITAGGDLGLVFAVFALLRELGCRFSMPGPEGEFIPRMPRLTLDAAGRAIEPLLRYRALQFAYLEPLERDIQSLDWMVRNGMNFVTYRLAHDAEDDRVDFDPHSGEAIVGDKGKRPLMTAAYFDRCYLPEVRRRGLKLDFGHHNLLFWVPPHKHLRSHPEWYALRDGVRGKTLTQLALCTSERGAVDALIQAAREYLRAHPEIGVLGIIPEDGIGMCQCERCVALDDDARDAFRPYQGHLAPDAINQSKSRRYAHLLNTVARALRDEFPRVLVEGAAYADLQWPADGVEYEPNVTVWLAIYWRDGARPLLDRETSPPNQLFAGLIDQWRARLGERLSLYEYYMGMNAQASLPYPMSRVLIEDWRRLHALRLCGATIQCFSGVHQAYAFNLLAFARCGWERDVNHDALLDEFLQGAFGSAGVALLPIYEALIGAVDDLGAAPLNDPGRAPPEIPSAVLIPDLVNIVYLMRRASPELVGRCLADARGRATTQREHRQLDRFEHYMRYARMAAELVPVLTQHPDAEEPPPLELLLEHIRHPRSAGWIASAHAANWRRLYQQHAAARPAAKSTTSV